MQQQQRRNRVAKRRQQATLFSKSEELDRLAQLCKTVAGAMSDDTYWNKLFVADPDFVLASKAEPEQKLAAHRRADEAALVRARIADHTYSAFPQPDALPGAPVVYRRRQPIVAAAVDQAPIDGYESVDDEEDNADAGGILLGVRGRGRGRGRAPIRRVHGDIAPSPNGVGQRMPADETWPERAHNQRAAGPISALQQMLVEDRAYFDMFGAYMSPTMMAATKSVVGDIRVLDTVMRNIRHIPIRRLVSEPLVSTWFATWIAAKILTNRALSGKTWHKDVIIASIGNQVDSCRAFFLNPQRFTRSPQIFEPFPLPGPQVAPP
jgi:hypothetical protein